MRTCGARRNRSSALELLEPRLALTANFIISEFLADNNGGLLDRYGVASDWIEIHNQGDTVGSLNGYYLTDKASNKTKWQFPNVTLSADGYLVVFADTEHNDRDPAQELHTGFALGKDGEYLGLIAPDGVTVIQEFAPTFPPQAENVSYGPGQVVTTENLVTQGSAAKTIVPTAANHATYDSVWKNQNYTPDANWISGPTAVGFGQTFNGFLVRQYAANVSASSPIGTQVDNITEAMTVIDDPTAHTSIAAGNYATLNFLNTGSASSAGHYGSDVQFPGQTGPTNYNNFVTETHALVTIPTSGNWTFGIRSNEGFELNVGDFSMTRPGTGNNTTDVLSTFTFDTAGVYELDLYHFESTGDAWLELFAAPGSFTIWNAASFDLVDDTANGGLAVKSDLVGSSGASISQLLGTSVQSQMLGVNSSLYTRIAFNVNNPAELDQLKLRMRYDDGFVAYLNGTEIARKNAPGTIGAPLTYNAVATANRTGDEVLTAEEFDVTAFLSLLTPGQNVLAIQGLNFTASDPDVLVLPELISTDVVSTGNVHFTTPTPGAANGNAYLGLVADTNFSEHRGFFDTPFQVTITTQTPGAQIYYTTNGLPPTQAGGTLYTGPITISVTTVLRAAAFKSGYVPTDVDTQSYLFLNDIVRQSFQSTVSAGFPTTWGSYTGVDYGLDPDVIGNFDANGNPIGSDLFGGVYAAQIKAALLSVPTMSIVMNTDDLFGINGIYSNPTLRTDSGAFTVERPTSVEYITTDGSPEFQIDAGIRIQGAFFRANSASRKHSFRLLFKSDYGASKLDFPLFGNDAVSEFDTLTLRAQGNDGYTWSGAGTTPQYIRDEFGRSLQRAMGDPSAHGNFVNLYINGVYWGLYNPVERPDNDFGANYISGVSENWDSVHDDATTNGDLTAWNAMFAKAQEAGTSLAAWMELQGKNLNGTPNPATPPLLNVTNYANYILLNAWGGNWDWPRKNFWAGRDRDPLTTTGFEFFNWDFENTMGNNRSRSPLDMDVFDPTGKPSPWFVGPNNAGQPHLYLAASPEYRLLFADEVQKFFFNDGVLTPAKLIERYSAIADQVDLAMVGESARWGDMQTASSPLTQAQWQAERDWILNTYLPQRTAIVLDQLKLHGLFPNVNAPAFNQLGGNYAGGFKLSMTNPNTGGTILYTLDGSDPRLLGGAQNPGAKNYTGSFLLAGNVMVKARYLSAGGEWSALVEAPFTQNAVGLYPGDYNRDGRLTVDDLPAMFAALTDLNAYRASKSLSPADLAAIGDLSGDGNVTNRDIQPFLDTLAGLSAGGGSGAAASAESSANGNAMIAQSTVAPLSIVIDMTAAPTDVSMTVAASFGSGSIADEAAPESVSIPTSPLLVFTISSAITVNPSANDRPAANNSDSSPPSSFNDSAVRHLQLDDFYRQLSITATPKADTGHATGIDAGVEQTTNSCVDELLADLVDPQLSAL